MIAEPDVLRRVSNAIERFGVSLRSMAATADVSLAHAARLAALLLEEHSRATNAYALAHDGCLPGSERTARLRKKRRDAVLRWWREQ
jgi:hypothetical protein